MKNSSISNVLESIAKGNGVIILDDTTPDSKAHFAMAAENFLRNMDTIPSMSH